MIKAVKFRNRKAFTLLEVVLALMIMASGLFILTNSWSGTYNRLRKTQNMVQLASLLERKVTEIEREYKNKSLDSIPDEKSDTFGGDLPDYSWSMKSKKIEIPDLSSLVPKEEGSEKSGLDVILKTFTEHLTKTIKEVSISVTYTGGKKPQVAAVTIYMIDYDKPLSLSTGP